MSTLSNAEIGLLTSLEDHGHAQEARVQASVLDTNNGEIPMD
eukprot:CAMPEP_0118879006 /NCGR_PEP_ID=MMETSP1163-20130328/18867_1 /TAXON_ID=124430 /ORGANISM="Phaeomonas parva, Strain CCMP2877" /LENGTH=41 /DNA_ID= /DNA_START= /DNA_END= /DNA_ORIENTATION=